MKDHKQHASLHSGFSPPLYFRRSLANFAVNLLTQCSVLNPRKTCRNKLLNCITFLHIVNLISCWPWSCLFITCHIASLKAPACLSQLMNIAAAEWWWAVHDRVYWSDTHVKSSGKQVLTAWKPFHTHAKQSKSVIKERWMSIDLEASHYICGFIREHIVLFAKAVDLSLPHTKR